MFAWGGRAAHVCPRTENGIDFRVCMSCIYVGKVTRDLEMVADYRKIRLELRSRTSRAMGSSLFFERLKKLIVM